MKVRIESYPTWVGPYQIAKALTFWSKDGRIERRLGKFLSEGEDGKETMLSRICNRIHSMRGRKVSVHVDNFDTYSMDSTLALIIHPMLLQLKDQKHGSPLVDDSDVPENLRRTAAPEVQGTTEVDANFHPRWDWLLDEMIWAFGEIRNGCPGEDAEFGSSEQFRAHEERMSRALTLFGKYYRALWT